MKLLVCGSRDWTNCTLIEKELYPLPYDTQLIHGGCRGADTLAHNVATELGWPPPWVFPAEWRRLGPMAGPIRNARMLREKPDLVLAFTNDLETSKGTRDMVEKAWAKRVPVKVVGEND